MAGAAPPATTTTRFVLVRHGEAEGNRELRYLGTTDAPLTQRGQAQAQQLADAVRPFRPTVIYSSPLLRARQTAEAIGAALRLDVPLASDLREQSYGDWENRLRDDVAARDPERLAQWEASADVAPPGGESLAAMRKRVVVYADALAERHPGATVLLASHVGPIKMLVCAALALPTAGARRMWLDPASICVVDWRLVPGAPSSATLRVFNAIAHLDPPVRWIG